MPTLSRSGSLLTRDNMETRRLAAARDLQAGTRQSVIAARYEVSRTTASRWATTLANAGIDALAKHRAPGRPPRLTLAQFSSIRDIIASFDAAQDRLSCFRLAAIIEERFGVHYDTDHVGRIMNKLGVRRRKAKADYYVRPSRPKG